MSSIDSEMKQDFESLWKKEIRKNANLENEILRLRKVIETMSTASEAEEECITMKLMKRLKELHQEKERIANAVEHEEEYRTNKLGLKVITLQREKVDLANQLSMEQEAMVNRLTRKLSDASVAQINCITAMEQEEEMLMNTLQRKLQQSKQLNSRLEKQLESRQISMESHVQCFVGQLMDEKNQLEEQIQRYSAQPLELLRTSIDKFHAQHSNEFSKIAASQEEKEQCYQNILQQLNMLELDQQRQEKASRSLLNGMEVMKTEIGQANKQNDSISPTGQACKRIRSAPSKLMVKDNVAYMS